MEQNSEGLLMGMLGDCHICDEYDNLNLNSNGAMWVCPECMDWLEDEGSNDQDDSVDEGE